MSWLYSRALVEEYSEGISLDGEPCALWNGKPTQLPSWCSDKTMARCQLSQSGMTFKPLTASHGEDVLTSFLEAFPAKTSVAPAKEQASKESDLPCGRTWRESLEKFDLDTHTWKTHQCLWVEDLQPSSVILPKWGMMRSGVLWERTTLPRLTSETGSGSWPTPTCQEVEHPDAELTNTGRRLSKDGMSSHSLNLADSVKQWPTPCTRDYKGANAVEGLTRNDGKSRMDQLPNAVAYGQKSWPTPRCFMHKDAAYDRGKANLGEVVCGEEGATIDNPINGQLNPDWVEWLMGWPIGWTSMDSITELDWRDWSVDPADELPPQGTIPTASAMTRGAHRGRKIEGNSTTSIGKGVRWGMTIETYADHKGAGTGTIPRVATGIKNRVGRLKAIGNGQVPQVAAMAWRILSK
jgi:hypothetical protein